MCKLLHHGIPKIVVLLLPDKILVCRLSKGYLESPQRSHRNRRGFCVVNLSGATAVVLNVFDWTAELGSLIVTG